MGTEYEPLAQQAEHLTFNQRVWSSNLQWLTSTTADVLNHVSFSFFQKHDRRYHITVNFSFRITCRAYIAMYFPSTYRTPYADGLWGLGRAPFEISSSTTYSTSVFASQPTHWSVCPESRFGTKPEKLSLILVSISANTMSRLSSLSNSLTSCPNSSAVKRGKSNIFSLPFRRSPTRTSSAASSSPSVFSAVASSAAPRGIFFLASLFVPL